MAIFSIAHLFKSIFFYPFFCLRRSSANRYFLRTMAKVGAGASEYFDSKVKSKWQKKVESLLTKSQQPVLTSVSVAWQQFDNDAPTPIQAPNQILSLFNGSRQVVYGFVPYCTQV